MLRHSGWTCHVAAEAGGFATDSFIKSRPLRDNKARNLRRIGLEDGAGSGAGILRAERVDQPCVSRAAVPCRR